MPCSRASWRRRTRRAHRDVQRGHHPLVEQGVITNRARLSTPARSSPPSAWARVRSTTSFTITRRGPAPDRVCERPVRHRAERQDGRHQLGHRGDLTGQVCADSVGHYFYAGIGGQVDFIRGAARSRGGKPIIRTAVHGDHARCEVHSRIVSSLQTGAGVVTSRGDVHYVVTEWAPPICTVSPFARGDGAHRDRAPRLPG